MPTERKCPSCGTWNLDQDYCSSCKTILSPDLIEIQREKEREHRRFTTPPSSLDVFLDKWKNHRFWILRILYKIIRTVSFIFVGIASIFAYLAASPNG
jgi:ribosomal protein L32